MTKILIGRSVVEQALGRHVDIAAQAIEWERRAA